MPNSYLPSTDTGLRDWAVNFTTQIVAEADPTVIGLTADQVTNYASLSANYAARLTAATDPSTRGKATVFAKNEAKAGLIAESRKLAMTVTNHPGVTDQQRLDMGLTVRDDQPTPVPVPSAPPVIDIASVEGHRVNLRLHDGQSTGRGKPEGVAGATLLSYVGDEPPTDIADWKFERNTSRTLVTLDMAATVPAGSKVWVTAFWFNRKAQSGPATPPVSTYIGGGLSQAA